VTAVPQPVKFLRRTVYETLAPEQLVERYLSGSSLDDLGMLTGTSPFRVRKVLVSHGVTIRPPCRHPGPNPSRYVRNKAPAPR
jgi:hypothetical protein